jgi:hypothetical protein
MVFERPDSPGRTDAKPPGKIKFPESLKDHASLGRSGMVPVKRRFRASMCRTDLPMLKRVSEMRAFLAFESLHCTRLTAFPIFQDANIRIRDGECSCDYRLGKCRDKAGYSFRSRSNRSDPVKLP